MPHATLTYLSPSHLRLHFRHDLGWSHRDKNLLHSRSPKAEIFWDRRWLQGTIGCLWEAVILLRSLMPRPEEVHLCWMLRTRSGNLLTWAIENIWYLLQYQGTFRILTYYHLSLVVFLPHSWEDYVKMTCDRVPRPQDQLSLLLGINQNKYRNNTNSLKENLVHL